MPAKVPPLDLSAVQIPLHFRCPISLELMRDPVTVCTGQTYDRCSIESWVATGNTTCPVTRHPLPHPPALIPNHTLRRLIHHWCSSHPGAAFPSPKHSPADPALLRSLLALAASPAAAIPRRLAALRRLRALSASDPRARLLLADHRQPLLLLAFSPDAPADLPLAALTLLASLPLPDADCRSVASRPERLALLSSLLRSRPEARAPAAAMIEAVARSADLRAAVGAFDGLMDALVAASRDADPAAVRAVHALCAERRNRAPAAAAGAVAALARAAPELSRSDAERAAATVEALVRAGQGAEADGVVAAMAGLLERCATDAAAEHAAGALVAACERWGEASRREAVGRGVVAAVLVMVQGGCSERGRRKAQRLLKLLLQDTARTHGNSDDFLLLPLPLPTKPQQQAVPCSAALL